MRYEVIDAAGNKRSISTLIIGMLLVALRQSAIFTLMVDMLLLVIEQFTTISNLIVSILNKNGYYAPPGTVGNPQVTIFPPDDNGQGTVTSTDGGPVPVILPPPLIGGGDLPYDTKVTIDTKPGETYKPGDTVALPVGNNTLTYTATDNSGNTSSTTTVITVGM